MKSNNLVYITDIANLYLLSIHRHVQCKPTVDVGNYSCITSYNHYITTNQRFAIHICNKSFDSTSCLGYSQTLFYRIIRIEQYTG